KVLTKEDLDVLNSEKLDSDMRKNREELLDIMNMELLSPSTSKDDKLEKEKEEKKKKLEEERLRKEEEEKKKE
ncbi:MAG: hypothetical protein LBG48_01555, partial [Rickettsiales bacterium]|nr:hypothetical protein [Rickettsiales bacterium]